MIQNLDNEAIQTIKSWLGTGSINIFGRPFSGKDTQARTLADYFDASIIGGGDIIRSSTATSVKQTIDSGSLAPQKDYLRMVLPYLSHPEYTDKPLILSSLGRWHGEEEPIMQAAKESGHEIKAVIYLDIDDDIVMERWQAAKTLGDRGDRNDDNATSITKRLDEFRDKTLPVINYYDQHGLLIHIDGTSSPTAVTQEIISQLFTFSKQ